MFPASKLFFTDDFHVNNESSINSDLSDKHDNMFPEFDIRDDSIEG